MKTTKGWRAVMKDTWGITPTGWNADGLRLIDDVNEATAVIEQLRVREAALPSYKSCSCGGDVHAGEPCGKGMCDCQEYRLEDAEGHDLAERVAAYLTEPSG